MSIRDEIHARQQEGRLFVLNPIAPGSSPRRAMFVTVSLNQMLEGPWDSRDDEIRFSRLRADLDHYVEGGFIDPKYLTRLRPKREEVWEIRSPRPSPSIRVFGRFALRDVFIATHYEVRPPLRGFGSRQWRDAIERCKTEWRNLFPSYQPFSGSQINEYVSNAADPARFDR